MIEDKEALYDFERPSSSRSKTARPRAYATTPASILLRRWWIVLGGALVITAGVYAVSKAVPATYTSSAKVAVVVSGTDVNDTSLGANNLAGQYAQEVSATSVLVAADKALADPAAGIPSTAITGGQVGAQNLISIQATANSPDLAQQRAAAVTGAFVKYITRQVEAQAAGYRKASLAQLQPLNTQIAQTQDQIQSAGPGSAAAVALESELGTLVAQRAAAEASVAQTAEAGRPS
ncbi:MAG: hypothetical protein ACLPV4_16415, partial [Solirubrobacteraceae bacterium]